ncbi:MAG TPA: S-layer homology domain-containing protein [Chloroflexia bacterium]
MAARNTGLSQVNSADMGAGPGVVNQSNPVALPTRGVTGDLWADVVLGKPRFSESAPYTTVANKLYWAHGTIVDRSSTPNKLYVYDSGNNRILGLDLGTCLASASNPLNCSADLVFGQPDMSHAACNGDSGYQMWRQRAPASASTLCLQEESQLSISEGGSGSSMAVDAQGNLYVTDFFNHRVLKYNSPFTTDTVADEVWGQDDFSGNTCNKSVWPPNATTLCFDWGNSNNWTAGLDIDSGGNLWVVDSGNNRLLRFPPGARQADLVIGQPGFDTRYYGYGELNRLQDPGVVRVSSRGWLYVTDHFNRRVMVFEPPFTSGMSGRVFGSGMARPAGIEFEPGKPGVWIADEERSVFERRDEDTGAVLEMLGRLNDGNLLGWATGSVGIDSAGNKYIAIGTGDYRYDVLMFAPGATTSPTKQLFGNAPGSGNYFGNKLTAYGMSGVSGVEIVDNQLIVADEGRVLFWNNPASLTTGQPADGVTGGPAGFTERQQGCCLALKADKSHHLYVSFGANANLMDRIHIYQLPLTSGALPVRTLQLPLPVLGGGQITNTGDFQAFWGIAPSADGRFLWLSHAATHRVFRVRDPLTNPVVDVILGQVSTNGTQCNQGRSAIYGAALNTLCYPGALALDRLGNLWVSDHSLEIVGNMRLLEFDASLFPTNNQQVIYAIPATRELSSIAVWQPAFSADNTMVVGYNGYWYSNPMPSLPQEPSGGYKSILDYAVPGGAEKVQRPASLSPEQLNMWQNGRFPGIYAGPLADGRSRYPDVFLKDYGSMSYTAVFDEEDNLYVGDLNRGRVLIYKKPLLNLSSPTSTAISTSATTSTPTSTATTTTTATATATTTTIPTSTRTSTSTATSTSTPTNTRTPISVATPTATLTITTTATPLSTGTVASSPSASPSYTVTVAAANTKIPTITPSVCSVSFTDVPPGSSFEPYVACLVCRGILSGYNTGERCAGTGEPCFRPGESITRGQMAKIVSNAAGFTEDHVKATFSDVATNHTFYIYIQRLASRNIVSGYGTAAHCPAGVPCFLPGATVSRGQMAKFVASAAGFGYVIPPSQQTFADVDRDDAFWLYIERLASRNVVGGYACGQSSLPGSICGVATETCDASNRPYYRPCALVTRGQAAKFVSLAFFPACEVP